MRYIIALVVVTFGYLFWFFVAEDPMRLGQEEYVSQRQRMENYQVNK